MQASQKVILSFPAERRFLSLVGAVAREVCEQISGLSSSSGYNVQLAVDEAVVNIITHAYQDDPTGLVEITFRVRADRLVVQIRDWGLSFDPSLVPSPDLSHPQDHGYGVYLIRRLMDDVAYENEGEDGNCVTLVKRLG